MYMSSSNNVHIYTYLFNQCFLSILLQTQALFKMLGIQSWIRQDKKTGERKKEEKKGGKEERMDGRMEAKKGGKAGGRERGKEMNYNVKL